MEFQNKCIWYDRMDSGPKIEVKQNISNKKKWCKLWSD